MTAPLRLAVWKFASCDGCQLALLESGDLLLELAEAVEIAHFAEASSSMREGPWDLSLVEGSITTAEDIARIRHIRENSRLLVAIGACATAGGIQALRNVADAGAFAAAVYPHPEILDALETSTPVSDHVAVDLELQGCPISSAQLLEVITALLSGRKPRLPEEPVCFECKRAGHPCVLVANGTPCLGPVTTAGCGALCPAVGRGCYGCFGPLPGAVPAVLSQRLAELGLHRAELTALYRSFAAAAPANAEEAARQE